MAYNRTDWKDRVVQFPNRFVDEGGTTKTFTPYPGTVTEEGTFVTADRMKAIHDGIEQNNLFNMLLTPGRYIDDIFDYPNAGDITQEIRVSSDNSLYASLVTEFNSPSTGNITVTLECTDLGIHTKIVTEFNVPSSGRIRTTSSEVVI